MPILAALEAVLASHIESASQIVVAYSGGLDSTVLLHAVAHLYQTRCPLVAVHVNHHLSEDADQWQVHCAGVCQTLGIDFIACPVHLSGKGKGLEAQARQLRYAALADSIKPHTLLLTGQHQQDQVETFLLQLKRGAGPKGLSAMPQCSRFADASLLLRPLLNCTRQALNEYAAGHRLHWIEDHSNLDSRFERNFLRHQVLPHIHQRWPGFDSSACRSIALIGEQQQLVDELAAADLLPLKLSVYSLSLSPLRCLSEVRQRNVLRYWIAGLGIELPSYQVLDKLITELIDAKPDAGPKVQWGGYQARRYQDVIYLFDNGIEHSGEDCALVLDRRVGFGHGIGVLALLSAAGQAQEPCGLEADAGLMLRMPRDDEPLSVCFDRKGISCRPEGSVHRRTLRQLFKQNRVPPWQRNRIPLIYYHDQLAAVAGCAGYKGFVCEGFGGEALCVKGEAVVIDWQPGCCGAGSFSGAFKSVKKC